LRECRIGSPPWFAGVFWLVLSLVAHSLAALAIRLRAYRAAWLLIRVTQWCCRRAAECAVEGGAEL